LKDKRTLVALTIGFGVILSGLIEGFREPLGAGPAFYSLIPPFIAIFSVLLTRKLVFSLLFAILSAGFLSAASSEVGVFEWIYLGSKTGLGHIWNSGSDWTNIQILSFVFFIMGMISVIGVSGGFVGVVKWLAKYAKGPTSTQFVTVLMGLAVFIDDYANTMVVGNTMRSMSDEYKVSREKLSFLVDATSAPVSGIAFVSTWIGYEVGLFNELAKSLGISNDGYSMFLDAVVFRFYCLMMVGFVLVNSLSGRDYGPMFTAENRARKSGELMATDASPLTSKTHSAINVSSDAHVFAKTALIPIGFLFVFLIAGLWYDGGGFQKNFSEYFQLTTWREVISSSENNILILGIASFLGTILSVVCSVFISKLSLEVVLKALLGGMKGAFLPGVILVLAWSMRATCDDLKTGQYLVSILGDSLSAGWFPSILFVISGVIAFSTGTSWGTMAILIPTTIPLAFQLDGGAYGLTTMISMAAVLDGSIFGDHCSPISDTTLMSSISSSCDHIHHVKTQLPYALTVAGMALFLGYLPSSFGYSPIFGVAASVFFSIAIFRVIGKKVEG